MGGLDEVVSRKVVSYFKQSFFSILLDWTDVEPVAKQKEHRQQ